MTEMKVSVACLNEMLRAILVKKSLLFKSYQKEGNKWS